MSRSERANLTSLGRRLHASVEDPYVLALADVVARAEGTDFAGQPGFGYGEALGRYRLLDDGASSAHARTDCGQVFVAPPDPSPAVQDLLFVYTLYKRGVYADVIDRRRPDLALRLRGGNPPIRGLTRYVPLSPEYPSLENAGGLGFYRGQCTWFGRQARSLLFLRQRLAHHLGHPPADSSRAVARRQLGRAVTRMQHELVRAGYLEAPPPERPVVVMPAIATTLADLTRGKVLREGARGRAVEKLQQQLVRTGFLTPVECKAEPGVFGPATRRAVEAFQRCNRLDPPPGLAGMVARTTWHWLLNSPDRSADRSGGFAEATLGAG